MDWIVKVWAGLGAAVIAVLATVLAIKVLWNFGSAYVLIKRSLQSTDSEGVSISLHPMLDALLLVLSMVVSVATIQAGLFRVSNVALYGIGGIVASYLHFFVVGMLFGVVRNAWRKGK